MNVKEHMDAYTSTRMPTQAHIVLQFEKAKEVRGESLAAYSIC